MGKKPTLLDLESIDMTRVVANQDQVREVNFQRFEMEMLTGIVHEDVENQVVVSFLDVTSEAFWVPGHMPGFPIMPGVLICEAAAQTISYFAIKEGYLKDGVVGLAGLDSVRFRGTVRPGDRLVLIVRIGKIRHGMMTTQFEAVVNGNVVAEGEIRGVRIPTDG